MKEFSQKLQIESTSFPKLISKHLKEMVLKSDAEILYHQQAHEIYLYTFYKNIKFDYVSTVKINNFEGYALSPIEISSFSLKNSISCDKYFNTLLNAPIPFIFIPKNIEFSKLKEFCKGAFKFEDSGKEGILMDLAFACSVGIDFIACEYLLRKDISILYIGLSYVKE